MRETISIHTLRVESNLEYADKSSDSVISIHTLRVESNSTEKKRLVPSKNFNPYSPCGE